VLNRYVASANEITTLESGIRATGTFSFITGLEVFAFVGVWAGMVLLSLAPGPWTHAGGLVTIGAALGCGLASVSRAPLIIGPGMLIAWAWYSRKGLSHLRAIFLSVLLITLTILVGLAPVLMRLGQAVVERHAAGGDSFTERAFGQFGEGWRAACWAPFGVGLGTEQVGGNYASKGVMTFTTFENQVPRLILETGLPGLLGFLIICAGAILALQRAKGSSSNPQKRAMLLATQLLLGCLFYTNVVFNHTASAFAWMIFAAVMASAMPSSFPDRRHESEQTQGSRSPFHCAHAAD
jgi:hypothetical protein